MCDASEHLPGTGLISATSAPGLGSPHHICTGTRLALVHREMSAPPPSALAYGAAVFRRISSPDAEVAGRTGMRWSVLVWPPEKAVLVLD